MMARRVEKEETLDPENWATMRALGYKMLDDVLDSLENIRSSPVWEPMAEDVFRKICEPLPREPQGPEKVYKDFCELREMNRGTGSIHPRFWGWVMGTGNVMSGYADMLASGLNAISGSSVSSFSTRLAIINLRQKYVLLRLISFQYTRAH